MGFADCEDCIAKDVIIRSNKILNDSFSIKVEGKGHSYKVYWKLHLTLTDKKNKPLANAEVSVFDAYSTKVMTLKSSIDGKSEVDLLQIEVNGEKKKVYSPYTVKIGRTKVKVPLQEDTNLTVVMK